MIAIYDGQKLELAAYRYDPEEVETTLFALELYGGHLAAGNLFFRPKQNPIVPEALEFVDGLKSEVTSGMTIFNPDQHEAVVNVLFPQLLRSRDRLDHWIERKIRESLGIRPYDIVVHSLTALTMMRRENAALELA